MTERIERIEMQAEILEAALGALEEGIVVLDVEARVLFWNPGAATITGYHNAEMLSRTLPAKFYQVDVHHRHSSESDPEWPQLVNLCHSQGHSLPAMLRRTPLRDALGKRFGTLLRFHPVEEIDTLPHGDTNEEDGFENQIEQSQAGIEERLDEAWREWASDAVPFGLLWITVDQAAMLRKTHGRDASEAMLAIVERTLLHGLRPAEILGRWGANEFLVLCHERSPKLLEAHARHLAEAARMADFRWWGDRVGLTVSIGAIQAGHHTASAETSMNGHSESASAGSLSCMLKAAQEAMQLSLAGGGNQIVLTTCVGIGAGDGKIVTGGQECSQS